VVHYPSRLNSHTGGKPTVMLTLLLVPLVPLLALALLLAAERLESGLYERP